MIFEFFGLPSVGKSTLAEKVGKATGLPHIYVENFSFSIRLMAIYEMPRILFYFFTFRLELFKLILYGLCLKVIYRKAHWVGKPTIIDQGILQYNASVVSRGLGDVPVIKSIISALDFGEIYVVYISDGPEIALKNSLSRGSYTSFHGDSLADYERFEESIKEVLARKKSDFEVYHYQDFANLLGYVLSKTTS